MIDFPYWTTAKLYGIREVRLKYISRLELPPFDVMFTILRIYKLLTFSRVHSVNIVKWQGCIMNALFYSDVGPVHGILVTSHTAGR